MDTALIAPDTIVPTGTHRLDLLAHHDACRSCAWLYQYAREHQDLEALNAWRRQLAQHLVADRERQDFERQVTRRLLVPRV